MTVVTKITDPRGDWLQSFSGLKLYPLDPRPEDVRIGDIAHALAHTCRYGGHSMVFYSVAQHSVLLSRHVSYPNQLIGLLHDAPEYVLGDIVRPLKHCGAFDRYKEIERGWALAIGQALGLGHALVELPEEVEHFDKITMVATEKRDLLASGPAWAHQLEKNAPTLPEKIVPWSPIEAEEIFLRRYDILRVRP